MTDRNDLDALEAREAALAAEVERTTRERDETARLLAEARARELVGAPDPAPRRGGRSGLVIGAAIALAAGITTIMLVRRGDSPQPAPQPPTPRRVPVLDVQPIEPALATCAQLEPEQRAAERADRAAYDQALIAGGLQRTTLDRQEVPPSESWERIDRAVPRGTAPWVPFRAEVGGRMRTMIASEIVNVAYGTAPATEFARDAAGDVWRLRQSPQLDHAKHVRVEACSWGCWGQPPSGAARPDTWTREVWILREGHVFRGDRFVMYPSAALVIDVIDQHCTAPG